MGTRPRLGQVWATRWLEPCGGRVGMTPGYPGHGLCKHVGDAVRGHAVYRSRWGCLAHYSRGWFQGSCGTCSGGFERRTNSMMWVTCTKSAELKTTRIAASSVMGHSSY